MLHGRKWACIVRLGSIGDNLIVSSVFPRLKERGYRLEVICQEPASAVYENNPHIDKLTIWKIGHMKDWDGERWHQFWAIRATEYDFFVNLSHSVETHCAFFPSDSAFWWPASYRRQVADRSYLAVAHDLCQVEHRYRPRFFPTEAEAEKAQMTRELLGPRPVVAWMLAGSRLDKLYPHAAMCAARLIRELGVTVVLMGSPTERELGLAKAIEDGVRVHNGSTAELHAAVSDAKLGTEWPLRRSLSFLQLADLVVTPDSGPAWSVACEAMPKIMLLGHASPKNITHGWVNTATLTPDVERVPCWPCHQLHAQPETCFLNAEKTGAACISDVSVERILESARAALTPKEASR